MGMCNGRGTVSNGGTFKLAGQWFNRLLMEREIRDKIDTGITVSMELLSNKREAFCRYIAIDGLTASDSYRKAYNSNPINQSSIHEQASKLLRVDKVSTRIEALKADISEKIASEIVFDKQRIISELHVNMLLGRETKQLAASNQAIKLIGSAVGSIFEPDTVAVSVTGSVLHGLSDDVLEQLAAMASEPVSIDDTAAIEADYKMLDSEAS